MSQKTLDRQSERDEVREKTLRRAGFRCQAPGVFGIRCSGHLDVHEVFTRGTCPGSQYDDTVTIALCRAHHRYVDDHPQDAHDAGLRAWSWERPTDRQEDMT